jgi:hypothetical protein
VGLIFLYLCKKVNMENNRNKVHCLVYDYTGDINNVYVRVSKVYEVDENVYVKIQKPVVNKGLLQYQHRDLCGTGWDEGEKKYCV